MIHKLPSPLLGHLRVVFELPATLWADHICVVVDFVPHVDSSYPLQQTRDGQWQVTLDLPEGRIYHFYYLIDGRRQTDHHSDGAAVDRSGLHVSLIDAGRKPAAHHIPGFARWQRIQAQPISAFIEA